MRNRAFDLELLITKLDITPSMYLNAVSKYQAIATYLRENGIEADFYPQGSFSLGTVVRPYINGKDAEYDLDVICEMHEDKGKTNARQVKQAVGILLNNSHYKDLLLPECDRCWTVKYALVDGVTGFSLDIVPAVHQDTQTIDKLITQGVPQEKAQPAISITEKRTSLEYVWRHSNPKGYFLWFNDINTPFAAVTSASYRQKLFEENRMLFSSIEAIPTELGRSSLQRVIQLLKRHRDIYYTNAKKWDKRPISAIITTLSAKVAQHCLPTVSVVDLLAFILQGLNNYRGLMIGTHPGYYSDFTERKDIEKRSGVVWIVNPVDPSDNYADTWDAETFELFFRWINQAKVDLVDSIGANDIEYYINLKNGLGTDIVESNIPESKDRVAPIISTGTKPWRSNGD